MLLVLILTYQLLANKIILITKNALQLNASMEKTTYGYFLVAPYFVSLSLSFAFDCELLLISPPHEQLPQNCKFVSLKTFGEYVCNFILDTHHLDMDVCTITHFSTK